MRLITALAFVFVFALLIGRQVHAEALSISGTIWEDKNADGIRQVSEPGIGFVPIELGKITNGVAVFNDDRGLPIFRDANGRGVRPDESGRYSFPNLEPGNYVVRVPIGSGGNVFFLTHPIRRGYAEMGTSVRVESQSLSSVDFGLYLPTSDIMKLRGRAWVDAAPAATETPNVSAIHAFIGATDCTGPGGILPTDQQRGSFTIGVVADTLVPGCGAPGREVRFEIDGRPANETVMWRSKPSAFATTVVPPDQPQQDDRLELTAGPAFAYVSPFLVDATGAPFRVSGHAFEAVVDGTSCGRTVVGPFLSYSLVVPSRDFRDGCGYPGALIHLRLDGTDVGPVITWRPGSIALEPIVVSQVSSSAESTPEIRPPSAGDAGLLSLAPTNLRYP